MYNVNGQMFDQNLNPVQGVTPYQAQQGASTVQQYQDVRDMQTYQTTPEADLNAKYLLAKKDAANQINNGGLGIKPPSALRQCIDMLGGLLIGYFAAKSGGASGTGAMLIGLTAAASNHDSDQKLVQRGKIAKQLYAEGGYSPDALYNFYKTGDDKGLEGERNNAAANDRAQMNIDAQTGRQSAQQAFTSNENDKRYAQQNALEDKREAFHAAHPVGGNSMALVGDDGYLTGRGQIAAQKLADSVRQTKGAYVRQLQTRLAKLASNEGMADKINSELASGDYEKAYSDYQQFKADLAQAAKGGNSSISPQEQAEVDKIGGFFTNMGNSIRKGLGFTPDKDTMNAVMNTFNNITDNDRSALNREVENEVNTVGGGVMNPAVVQGAASIIKQQEIGNVPASSGGNGSGEYPSYKGEQPVSVAPSGAKDGEILTKDGVNYVVKNGYVYPV